MFILVRIKLGYFMNICGYHTYALVKLSEFTSIFSSIEQNDFVNIMTGR